MRAWLIEKARARGTVTYSDVMNKFALTFYPLRNAMSRLGRDCVEAGEPVITALIVDKDTLRCSPGFFDEFHVDDDALERERCYAYWTVQPAAAEPQTPTTPETATPPTDSGAEAQASGANDEFAQRMARFSQVQTRPEQPAFRTAVFRAYGGRCAISGCAVPEALEAAHLLGRDWKEGHNSAADGILLRRDLHTLYARGLLRILEDNRVALSEGLEEFYGEFEGMGVASPA